MGSLNRRRTIRAVRGAVRDDGGCLSRPGCKGSPPKARLRGYKRMEPWSCLRQAGGQAPPGSCVRACTSMAPFSAHRETCSNSKLGRYRGKADMEQTAFHSIWLKLPD